MADIKYDFSGILEDDFLQKYATGDEGGEIPAYQAFRKPVTPVQKKPQQIDGLARLFEFNRDNILKGIIFSEILGAPKARRKSY